MSGSESDIPSLTPRTSRRRTQKTSSLLFHKHFIHISWGGAPHALHNFVEPSRWVEQVAEQCVPPAATKVDRVHNSSTQRWYFWVSSQRGGSMSSVACQACVRQWRRRGGPRVAFFQGPVLRQPLPRLCRAKPRGWRTWSLRVVRRETKPKFRVAGAKRIYRSKTATE
jgi:hypothetical protein